MHALRLLDMLGELDNKLLAPALLNPLALVGEGEIAKALIAVPLADRLAPVREHAIQIAAPRLREWPEGEALVVAAADDSDPRVRFFARWTLGELPADHDPAPLAKNRTSRCCRPLDTRRGTQFDCRPRNAFLKCADCRGRRCRPRTERVVLRVWARAGCGAAGTDLAQAIAKIRIIVGPERRRLNGGMEQQVPLLTGIADGLRRTRRDSTNLLTAVLGNPADANADRCP